MSAVRIEPVDGLPEITPGDDLAALILEVTAARLEPGTVVCVAQKLVSKAEGRIVDLRTVEPSPAVALLAEASGRDPRLDQVILGESAEVIRGERGVLICRTHHGFVCANAGVDRSNAGPDGSERAILLPVDPDGSARSLRAALQDRSGVAPLAVLISDSFGRAWRIGQVDVAIGVAGLTPTLPVDRSSRDRDGRALVASEPAIADELAAAADLARTKAGGQGVVLVHGLGAHVGLADGPGAAATLRARHEDLFGARNAETPPEH
ncbi:MAG: coenzyme F420-0:L-glutamate ligase [Solirubrobacteraceae bacterium]|nr:coenzyme F420-0:L-glutamate ligase [Solirubrobacteraceae bacterium]